MTMFFLLLISALFPYTTLFRSQLLGNAVGHQSGIELGLAYFSHPYVSGHAEHLACLLAQALDVLTLFANDYSGASSVNGNFRRLCRALDLYRAYRSVRQCFLKKAPDLQVGIQLIGKISRLRIPLGSPVLGNTQAKPGWMYLVTHNVQSSATTMVMWLVRFKIRVKRPLARGRPRLNTGPSDRKS